MLRLGLLLAALLWPALPAGAQQGEHAAHGDHGGHAGHDTAPAAAAPTAWTSLPTIERAGRGRSAIKVRVKGTAAEGLAIHPPAGEPRMVPVRNGAAEVAMRKDGNYHWLVARSETPAEVVVASATVYFPAPGPAPLRMLAKPKHELEVVPRMLPREHGHYRAREAWAFEVRFQGKPLAGATLHLQTRNGTHQSLVTDDLGTAMVVFPDDYPPGVAETLDHHARPPSVEFVLWTQHYDGGRRFVTAFNDTYRPHALSGKTVWPGAAFIGLGMLAAVPLLRRRAEDRP